MQSSCPSHSQSRSCVCIFASHTLCTVHSRDPVHVTKAVCLYAFANLTCVCHLRRRQTHQRGSSWRRWWSCWSPSGATPLRSASPGRAGSSRCAWSSRAITSAGKSTQHMDLHLQLMRLVAASWATDQLTSLLEQPGSAADALCARRTETFGILGPHAGAAAAAQTQFHDRIAQLVFTFPEDAKTSSGGLFWSAPKRFPRAITFEASDPVHASFAQAAAILKAQSYRIPLPDWARSASKVLPPRNQPSRAGGRSCSASCAGARQLCPGGHVEKAQSDRILLPSSARSSSRRLSCSLAGHAQQAACVLASSAQAAPILKAQSCRTPLPDWAGSTSKAIRAPFWACNAQCGIALVQQVGHISAGT